MINKPSKLVNITLTEGMTSKLLYLLEDGLDRLELFEPKPTDIDDWSIHNEKCIDYKVLISLVKQQSQQ